MSSNARSTSGVSAARPSRNRAPRHGCRDRRGTRLHRSQESRSVASAGDAGESGPCPGCGGRRGSGARICRCRMDGALAIGTERWCHGGYTAIQPADSLASRRSRSGRAVEVARSRCQGRSEETAARAAARMNRATAVVVGDGHRSLEFGVFYCRRPSEARGRIEIALAISDNEPAISSLPGPMHSIGILVPVG